MGLFQRKPVQDTSALMYTLGQNTTLLVVGLGNPGKKYDNTRHNIGFSCLDYFAKKQDFPSWSEKKDQKSLQTSKEVGGNRVILCKPTTYMNQSGQAVRAIQNFYKIDNSKTLVIYDELDIDFGILRTRIGGSSAGHNGVKSLIQHCEDDFRRLRIGIGPKEPDQIDSADFVLQPFNMQQLEHMEDLKRESAAIISEYIHGAGELTAESRTFLI